MEPYKVQTQTPDDRPECGHEPCYWQLWVDPRCEHQGDGSAPTCATEAGGAGAYNDVALSHPNQELLDSVSAIIFFVFCAVVVLFTQWSAKA